MNQLAIKIFEKCWKVPLVMISQFLNEMRIKKPHLQIEDLQFMKKLTTKYQAIYRSRDEDECDSEDEYDPNAYNGDIDYFEKIEWIYLKAFDTKQMIYKTLKVQFIELLKGGKERIWDKLKNARCAMMRTMKNNFVLTIYDYYFFTAKMDGSLPLYFVIEQELVEQTLNNYINRSKIVSSPKLVNHKKECLDYLVTKLKHLQLPNYRCPEEDRYYLVQNGDKSFSVKLDPLEFTQETTNQKVEENVKLYRKFYFLIEGFESPTLPLSEGQKPQEEREIEVDKNEMKDHSHNQDSEEDLNQESEEDMIQESEENSDQVSEEEDIFEQNHNQRYVTLKFSNEPIKQVNLIKELEKNFPLLLQDHNISLFEIISQHPKLDNFEFLFNEEDCFVSSVSYLPFEKEKYYLKCMKYKSILEAEKIYKSFQQLKEELKSIFIPILECELIPLEDSAYLLYVEQNFESENNKIIDLRNLNSWRENHSADSQCQENVIQSIKKSLLFWLIEQDEYLLSLNSSIPSIFELEVSIIMNKQDFTQVSFYLSNPFFCDSSFNFHSNINQIAQLAKAYFCYGNQSFNIIDQRIQQFARSTLVSESKDKNKRESFRSCFDNKFKQLHELTIKGDLQFNFEFNKKGEIILQSSKLDFSKISKKNINAAFSQGGFSFECDFFSMNSILGQLSNTSLVNTIKFPKERIISLDTANQHMNEFHQKFTHVTSLSLIVVDLKESGLSEIKFQELSQLENVTLAFQNRMIIQDDMPIIQKNVKNLMGAFKSQNLKRINFSSFGLFYYKDIHYPLSQIVQEMRKMVEGKTKKIKDSLQFVQIPKTGEGVQLQNFKTQIEDILSKFQNLHCSVKREKPKSKNYLVVFSKIDKLKEEEGDQLEIQLQQNDDNNFELIKFETKYNQRFNSPCNSNPDEYFANKLSKLVEDWLVVAYEIRMYKQLFETETFHECIHSDQNEVVKNTYRSQINLQELVIMLSYCKVIEEKIKLDKDYFCFSQLHQLHTLILVLNYSDNKTANMNNVVKGFVQQISSMKNIRTVKLMNYFSSYEERQVKNQFLKLKQLVSVSMLRTSYYDYFIYK